MPTARETAAYHLNASAQLGEPRAATSADTMLLGAKPAARPALADTILVGADHVAAISVRVVDRGAAAAEPRAHRFEQRRPLGEGGMAVVDLVHDNALHRDVAVKRVRDPDNPQLMSLFLREARITARLEHPNIVVVHDVSDDEVGETAVVMKVIAGVSLADVIDRLKKRDPRTVSEYTTERRLEVFVGILRALEHAHALGVIHRDIKPDNVMIGHHGEVVVVDWGVAAADGEPDIIPEGAVVGTPLYMAPEQTRGEGPNVQADIYSAGVLLYEFMLLRHYLGEDDGTPYDAMSRANQGWRWSLLDWHRPGIEPMPPMEIYHFLRKAMARNPKRRFVSISEMLTEISRILDGRLRIQCHITLVKSTVRRVGRLVDRFPWLSVSLFFVLLSLTLYGAYTLLRPLVS